VINSDILSSIEKDSPVISIRLKEQDTRSAKYTIWRCERGLEGEEFLSILTEKRNLKNIREYLDKSQAHHMIKLQARVKYLQKIL